MYPKDIWVVCHHRGIISAGQRFAREYSAFGGCDSCTGGLCWLVVFIFPLIVDHPIVINNRILISWWCLCNEIGLSNATNPLDTSNTPQFDEHGGTNTTL